MADLFITELAYAPVQGGSVVPMGQWPALATQQITTLSGTSQASAAFNAATNFICIHSQGICAFELGTAPTAVATANRRPADFIEYIAVPPGRSYKIAAILTT